MTLDTGPARNIPQPLASAVRVDEKGCFVLDRAQIVHQNLPVRMAIIAAALNR